MELFRFILPKKEICNETELYFKSFPSPESNESITYHENTQEIEFKEGSRVTFDTYFNSFSYSKYRKYTVVNKVGVSLTVKGKFCVKLIAARMVEHIAREILQEQIIEHDSPMESRLYHEYASEDTAGIYYIELTALTDAAIFYGGHYFFDVSNCEINNIKVAFVICTYKRENFVYRNIKTINDYIFNRSDSPVKDNISFIIIDNGQTLDPSKIESKYIKIFKNKNYGGSGGFTRGLIEAYSRRDEYTHVLLMDDDIVFEGEVLAKTINFLKVLKPEYQDIFIGAGMIVKDRPYLQHEAGVLWTGLYPERKKSDLDLRQLENIIFNEHEEALNYSGWWYMCMPLRVIDDKGLPFPFFIKADDIEYSIRSAKPIVLINGIGVWHEHFDNKHSALLEYYLKRNEAILAAIHFPELGALANMKKLLFAIGKQHLNRRYSAHRFLFLAYEDFLKGVDFFLRTDEADFHRALVEMSKKHPYDGSIIYFPIILITSGFHFFVLSMRLLGKYKTAAESYRRRMREITSLDFWARHLELGKEKFGGE